MIQSNLFDNNNAPTAAGNPAADVARPNTTFVVYRKDDCGRRQYQCGEHWRANPLFATVHPTWDAAYEHCTPADPPIHGITGRDTAIFGYLTDWHTT